MDQTNGFQVSSSRNSTPLTYSVEVAHGQIGKRHIDQIKPREDGPQVTSTPGVTPADSPVLDNFQYSPAEEPLAPQDPPESSPTPARRYPQRQRRPPDRFTGVLWVYLLTGEEMWYLTDPFML